MTAPLELLLAFANTLDVEEGTDQLGDREAAATWLTGSGLGGPVDREGWARLREVRAALRDLALANAVDPSAEVCPDVSDAAALLDADPALLRVAVAADGSAALVPASAGVDGAIGSLLAAVVAAQADGTWGRLKLCPADDCRWAYIDTSKNTSRTWCSMQVCGSRAKARAYRERGRQAAH